MPTIESEALAALGEPPLELRRLVAWYFRLWDNLCDLIPLPALTLPADCIGMIFDVGAVDAQIPSGFLLCYGQPLNRVGTYAALFAKIGTQWGVGDGSTTFNLPDLRDRIIIGKGDMGGSDVNLISSVASTVVGTMGGAETRTLVSANLPLHQNPFRYNIGSSANSNAFGVTKTWAGTWGLQAFVNASPNAFRGVNDFENIGSGTAFDVINPYQVCNAMIYTGA